MGTEEHLMGIREHEGHLDACFRPISSFTSALCSSMSLSVREGELLAAVEGGTVQWALLVYEGTGSISQHDVHRCF